MKTLFSYQTDIIQLSEKRGYHAVVILTKTNKGLVLIIKPHIKRYGGTQQI